MPIPRGDHHDLARCVAVIGEDDLMVELWEEQLPPKQWLAFANEAPLGRQMQTILQTQLDQRPAEALQKLKSDDY